MDGRSKDFEQESFKQLRPLAVGSEVLATAVCLLVLVIAHVIHGIPWWLYNFCVAEAIATYLTYKSTSTQQFWLTGLLLVCSCAACLGSLANAIGNPTFWFLPIGMVISLPVSALHARPLHAVTIGVAIWAMLFYVIEPHFGQPLDLILTLLLIATSMMLTLLVCVTFCRMRKDVFDLQNQLHDMAYKDTLTGLPNRRAFMQLLANTSEAAPLFFLMLDVDDFKSINDGYGHDVGDLVLVEVAKVLRQQGHGHKIARMGGEEFCMLSQWANVEAAQAHAQRIVDGISRDRLCGLRVTISAGLAERGAEESMVNLIRRADVALYEAKRNGKNRYAMAVKV